MRIVITGSTDGDIDAVNSRESSDNKNSHYQEFSDPSNRENLKLRVVTVKPEPESSNERGTDQFVSMKTSPRVLLPPKSEYVYGKERHVARTQLEEITSKLVV